MKKEELEIRVKRFIKTIVQDCDIPTIHYEEGVRILNEYRCNDLYKKIKIDIKYNSDIINKILNSKSLIDCAIEIRYHNGLLNALKYYYMNYNFDTFKEDVAELVKREGANSNE